MKAHFPRLINYYEIDPDYKLKLGYFFKLIQESAIYHSESVGLGSIRIRKGGFAWFLNKIGVEIHRYPEYKEEIEVVTWFRKAKRFKSYRDYEIYSGKEKIAEASSIWIYFDIHSNRISTIPDELCDTYTLEKDFKAGPDLDKWNVDPKFDTDKDVTVCTRFSDYDPNNHVNSAIYLDYVETLISRLSDKNPRAKSVSIQYKKEIDRNIESVKAGCKKIGNRYLFRIADKNDLYAYGEIELDNI